MRLHHLAIAFLAACASEGAELATQVAPVTRTDAGVVAPSLTFCKNLTVTGTVYYNDLRTNGRFDLRDPELTLRVNAPWDFGVAPGSMPYSTGTKRNYYGLLDAQVDIYEADINYGSGQGCKALDLEMLRLARHHVDHPDWRAGHGDGQRRPSGAASWFASQPRRGIGDRAARHPAPDRRMIPWGLGDQLAGARSCHTVKQPQEPTPPLHPRW